MIIYEKIFKNYGLSATQQEILSLVGKNNVILEIGPSTGYMTKAFLGNGCTVDIVEVSKDAIIKLPKSVRKIFNHSIEDDKLGNLLSRDYDFIIMADVLEHLVNPKKALKILYKIASDKTSLIVSLPNIASWVMRKQLFFRGDFEYQESGVLDKTHLHFYTVNSLPKFLRSYGWKVDNIVGTITRIPFEQTLSKIPIVGWIFKTFFYERLVEKYKNLSYYHFFVVAHK